MQWPRPPLQRQLMLTFPHWFAKLNGRPETLATLASFGVPPQYWVLSAERNGLSADKAEERYRLLRQYTMFVVALGKIGLGNINWFSEADIRENLVLNDSQGKPVPTLAEGFR